MNPRIVKSLGRIVILTLSLLSFDAFAKSASACFEKDLEKLPVLSEGRTAPLFVHAKKFRKNFVQLESAHPESRACAALSDTALYCLVAEGQRLSALRTEYGCELELKAEHERLKEILKIPSVKGSVSPETVKSREFDLMNEYKALKESGGLQTGYGLALTKLLGGSQQLEKIEAGTDWKALKARGEWLEQKDAGSPETFFTVFKSSPRFLTPDESSSLEHETLYENLHLFIISAVVCMLAFMLSIAGLRAERLYRYATLLTLILLGLEAGAMYLRVMISGRAPVTNMFETVMWAAFGVLVIALLMAARLKERSVLSLGLGANLIALFMLNFATTMLDGSIRPLVPVLRDNFWLSTHVTTVTLSYASFALSWMAANFLLIRYALKGESRELTERWNHVSRVAMQIGSVLLAAGLILGGVWADYSWGRFWGWDPKETWSLIALMVYIAILHGRYVGWFKDLHFAMAGAISFMFVLMAWFGVNYILAAGLHSYGFSSGGAAFLITAFGLQVGVLATVVMRKYGERPRSVRIVIRASESNIID